VKAPTAPIGPHRPASWRPDRAQAKKQDDKARLCSGPRFETRKERTAFFAFSLDDHVFGFELCMARAAMGRFP